MSSPTYYFGTGPSLEAAVQAAHQQIPPPEHGDVTFSRIVDWGAQYGGIIPQWSYWATLVETQDPSA